jgi:alkaline phosphatase
LRKLIKKAHQAGRKVRFWASPNKPEVWKKLMDEGADWINVDDLKGFNDFYRNRVGSNSEQLTPTDYYLIPIYSK